MELKTYHLNEEQTIARFYPTKTGWNKKLCSIDYYHTPYFLRQGLCFRGKFSLKRFLDAMHDTLQDFDFLFSQFYRSEGDLYAGYSTENNNLPFIELEIEKNEATVVNASTLHSILPDKVDERIRGVITDQLDALPMCVFKLTTCIDGFTIGCYWNHAFLDQSSMVYFFKYLSHIYSYGKDNISLKKPYLVDTDSLTLDVKIPHVFENLQDFREHSESFMGFKYIAPKTDNTTSREIDEIEPLPNLNSYATVDLNFNLSEINKLKDTTKQYLSVNDVIHAILLKIYSFNSDLPLNKYFYFGFACNMRKYCGFGEEAIGNVLGQPLMLLTLEDIKNKTILELAISNRQRVSELNIEFFKENLAWYRYLRDYHENPLHYASTFNLLSAKVTNWSTFNYESILFDGAAPVELKTPDLAPFRVNVISFVNKGNEKILKTSISVPFNGIELLRELEHTTGLFSSNESELDVTERQTQIETRNQCYWCIDIKNNKLSIEFDNLVKVLSDLSNAKEKYPKEKINLFKTKDEAEAHLKEKFKAKAANKHGVRRAFIIELSINMDNLNEFFNKNEFENLREKITCIYQYGRNEEGSMKLTGKNRKPILASSQEHKIDVPRT